MLPASELGGKHWSTMGGRIAIIADEAHRSHGKGTSLSIHEALGGQLNQIPNVTYFGFTATPSPSSLQLFGRLRQIPDGRLVHAPAHCYSMKQAVADGCILNVLKNYTTLRPVVQLNVSSADKSYLTRNSAMSSVLEMASKRREVLEFKVRVIARHFWRFRQQAIARGAADGTADRAADGSAEHVKVRAMVVTSSRLAVVQLCELLREELAKIQLKDGLLRRRAHRQVRHEERQRVEEEEEEDAQLKKKKRRRLRTKAGSAEDTWPKETLPTPPHNAPLRVFGAFSGSVNVASQLQAKRGVDSCGKMDGAGEGDNGGATSLYGITEAALNSAVHQQIQLETHRESRHEKKALERARSSGGSRTDSVGAKSWKKGKVVSDDAEGDGVEADAQVDLELLDDAEDVISNVTLKNADMIVVCNKLETGYNDPNLCVMYVDRELRGARAVQVLSRLNRKYPHEHSSISSSSSNSICGLEKKEANWSRKTRSAIQGGDSKSGEAKEGGGGRRRGRSKRRRGRRERGRGGSANVIETKKVWYSTRGVAVLVAMAALG
jgi:hypothetical protein